MMHDAEHRQYRVLKMEPLIGNDQEDQRTAAGFGTAGSAAGPTMQAAREFEGQTVTLNELQGMGRLSWLADRVARLDTASESYRITLEPVDSGAAAARDRPSGETGGSPQRPARQVAAPALAFDLAAERASLQQEVSWQRGDRNARTLVEEPSLRLVLVVARAGARFGEHQTRGWVSLQTLAGRGRVHLPDGTIDLPAGHVLALHHALPHDVEAVDESTFLLTVAWPAPSASHA